MRLSTALILPVVCAVAACGTNLAQTPPSAAPTRAVATLKTAEGRTVGTATLRTARTGMRLALRVTGLSAGEHGIHIHAVGKCEGPKFASAGGHWNPLSKQHGLYNPAGAHAGDMPNLAVAAKGSGIIDTTLTGTVAELLDADGAALVIHAKRDDGKTDPSGDSGDRIACAVLAAS